MIVSFGLESTSKVFYSQPFIRGYGLRIIVGLTSRAPFKIIEFGSQE
jgi:hypothetical protein